MPDVWVAAEAQTAGKKIGIVLITLLAWLIFKQKLDLPAVLRELGENRLLSCAVGGQPQENRFEEFSTERAELEAFAAQIALIRTNSVFV